MADVNQFITQLLHQMGAPDTPQNRAFMQNWQRWEGGWTNNRATFNPWNSTRGNYPGINDVGVRAYPNMKTGLEFTKQTLMNGRYPDIVAGLRDGNPYDNPIQDDLSVWLSGKPTGGESYAAKVMAGRFNAGPGKAPKNTPMQRPAPHVQTTPEAAQPQLSQPTVQYDPRIQLLMDRRAKRGRNPQLTALLASRLMSSAQQPVSAPDAVASVGKDLHDHKAPKGTPTSFKGKVLMPGTQWSGTHITDGLDWNNGQRTAQDVMAAAGTPVGAPMDGTIVRHGSAQGGQALYFKGSDGTMFWLGHIDGMLPVGTVVKKGQPIAKISSDHKTPHLHIDKDI